MKLPRGIRDIRSKALLGIAVTVALGALTACGSSSSSSTGSSGGSASKGALRITVFDPFSGPNAAFGPESMDPCLAATSLINADGGVLNHTLSCQAADNRGDPADAVLEAGKVVATAHPVLVLGPDT